MSDDYARFQDDRFQEIKEGEDLWHQKASHGEPIGRALAKKYKLGEAEVLDVYKLGMTGYQFEEAVRKRRDALLRQNSSA
jgi:hypothetical protein